MSSTIIFVSSTMVVMPASIVFASAIALFHSLNSCDRQQSPCNDRQGVIKHQPDTHIVEDLKRPQASSKNWAIRQKCENYFVHIVATFGKIRHRAGIKCKTGIKRDEGILHKMHCLSELANADSKKMRLISPKPLFPLHRRQLRKNRDTH
jgi:hypothetical protein